MKKLVSTLILMALLAAAACAETYVDNNGAIPDGNSYYGTWEQAYAQILNSHTWPISQYEAKTIDGYWNGTYISTRCRPVALTDVDWDGVPELMFMEVASGGQRGDFCLYSWSGNYATCRLYVPGITRLDYDDTLGFSVYCSSYGADTFVIEHYKYEWPWLLQFTRNAMGQYSLVNYLTAEFIPSDEVDDRYYWNGKSITGTEYFNMVDAIEAGKTRTVSNYFSYDLSTYGFDYTLSDALSMLQGSNSSSSTYYSSDVYGYTIDKLATRTGPSTRYDEGGTYDVKNQWIKVLAKAWDSANEIWWVKCEIPYRNEIRVLWTGYKRFDASTLSLNDLPDETPGGSSGSSSSNSSSSSAYYSNDVYGYTIDKLATRTGPSTKYDGGGTYDVKNQWIKVLAKAWDSANEIWWVKCEIPYRSEIRVLWTGYKRFDASTLSLNDLPEEVW